MPTIEPDDPPGALEGSRGDPATRARTEAAIEAVRQRGGVFVEAVRATRMAMALADPNLPGNPIVFANEALLELSGYDMDEVLGRQPHFMNGPETDPGDAAKFREAIEGDHDIVIETVQYRKDGTRFVAAVLLTGFKSEDGRTAYQFLSWLDVTRRIEAEDGLAELQEAQTALAKSEAMFREFGEASQDVLWIRDAATLQWTYLTPAFETIYGLGRDEALSGDNYRSWLDLIVPEDREMASRSIERVRRGEHITFDYRILRPRDGTIRWLRNTDFPIRDEDGEIRLIGGIGHDLTELRESDQRCRLLLAELQHRVRNIMAMIRSVARRTGETAESVEDYVQHLEGRISAMARTQSLLTREVHAGVDLESLILDEMEMQAAQPDHYDVTGPDVMLAPKAAEVLGLALHELATNSVKYGALSENGGRIDVRWALLDGDKSPQLSLIWSEFGVAIDGEPSRRGFGTELITQRVPYELQGTGTMEFRSGGLVATIEFPLADGDSILETGGRSQGAT